MHKLSEESFQRETGDGDKKETVKGYLAVEIPEDGDYSAGRNIGAVVFIVAPNEEKDEKPSPSSQQKR